MFSFLLKSILQHLSLFDAILLFFPRLNLIQSWLSEGLKREACGITDDLYKW